MGKMQGLTLIELLVALLIFSILITITSSALKQAFRVDAQLKTHSTQLRQMQFAMTLLERDIRQALNRPVRGEERRLFPGFVGEPAYIELTRGGHMHANPEAKASSLLRVAYLCKNHQLWRRIWLRLDPVSRLAYEDELLLDKLDKCRFAFLNKVQQILPKWHQGVILQGSASEALPRGVQVQLAVKGWGDSTFLWMVAGAEDAINQSTSGG